MNLTLSRRGLLRGAASAAAISAAPTAVLAQAQPAAPRVVTYTRRIDDTEVIALLDGYFLPAEGVVVLAERFWPTFEQIDTSPGAPRAARCAGRSRIWRRS